MQQVYGPSLILSRRGMALISSYLAVSLFLVFQAAYLHRVVSDHQLTQRYSNTMHGLHVGEAGVDSVLSNLRYLADYSGAPETLLGDGSYATDVAVTGVTYDEPLPQQELRITSTGGYPAPLADAPARVLVAMAVRQSNPFSYGLFAGGTIRATSNIFGTCIDSRSPMPCLEPWARIGTNSVGPNAVAVSRTTMTEADVVCGVGCNTAPDTDINLIGPEFIRQRVALTESKALPMLDMPPVPSEGALYVPPGSTITLTAGTHRFDSITVDTDGTLTADGPVEIFIEAASSGSILELATNAAMRGFYNEPPNFKLYIHAPLPNPMPISLRSNSRIDGAVYLSGAVPEIYIINGTIRGSLITAGQIRISLGLVFQYDYALSGYPAGSRQQPQEFKVQPAAWITER